MKKIFLFFVVTAILFAQPIKDDEWIESGQMLRFPANKYFTAVGIGSNEKNAAENAVVEIQRQISATVKSEQISKEFSLLTNKSSTDTSLLSIRSKFSVAGDIAGVEIIATSTRRDNFYAFAALEKEKFISLQKLKITELQDELIKTYSRANKAISEKKVALAISLLNSANEKITAIRSERILLSAATVLTENEEIPVSKADIDIKLAEMANSIKIISAAGDKQTTFTGEAPTEPFTVIVTANDQPIENLAIALFDEKNKKVASAYSDNDGTAYLFLDEKSPSVVGTYKYKAKFDLPNMQNLTPVDFSYSVKMRPISIWAQISTSVSPALHSGILEIERSAKEMLAQHGILDDRCGCVKISVLISDIQKEAIEGVSATRSFVRCDAVAQIILSDNNGKQLYSANTHRLGTGKDRFSAVADGLKKVQLGEILKDIQNAVQNYDSQEKKKMSDKSQIYQEKKIVVFPFIYRGFGGYWLSTNYESLSTMITTALVNTKTFKVLEYRQAEASNTYGRYDNPEIEQAKFLGADWIVTGNIARGNDIVEVDIRIVDVLTSQIVASVSAQGKNIYDFRDISEKLIKKLDIDLPNEGGTCCK
ncbi:MAG: LPP20 family lipoprotein [Chitinispirillales bacterium]|jgi:TolB-like protein|nr:LPP20 family lipoprotein [Chitinispirillales bacterium]